MTLINIWEQNEVLYNVTHPNYYDNNVEKNAIERMVAQLAEQNTKVTVDEVTAKMQFMRLLWILTKQTKRFKEERGWS